MPKYLFVLCPPYSGSTVLWKLLATSPNVSSFEQEGQFLDSVHEVMRDPWNVQKTFPWEFIKGEWDKVWDYNKPILLEKSPPNLVRAFEIEKVFQPSYFIALNRDPYAFCEGWSRRIKQPPQNAIQFWIKCAKYQIENIQGLKNITCLTYEHFANNPAETTQQLLEFIPELQSLETHGSFQAQTVSGYHSQPITNLNQIKIDLLSPKELEQINNVLKNYPHLMTYWGYQYVYPTPEHRKRHYKAFLTLKFQRLSGRFRRFLQRFAGDK